MERQEDLLLPGFLNPYYSVSHAFLNHDKLIGSFESLLRWRIGWGGPGSLLFPSHHRRCENMNETSFSGFLGIDVSKDKFDAYCIDIAGEKHFYLSCPMDREGFEKLVSRLGTVPIPQENLLIGMESTACYHMSLFSFLLAGGYTAVIINPLLISNFVKMQLRKTKTDKKDALVIAQFLLMHRDILAQTNISPHVSDLRDLSRQRESVDCQQI